MNLIKKLTSKNPQDFEPAAKHLIDSSDVELFKELLLQSDFLFDFVKKNVNQRLKFACNRENFHNLISFLKYYAPEYEDFIVSNLVKFANEDLTDELLGIFENGTDEEKTYCAKYFSFVKDPLALEFLSANAFSDYEYLCQNCAEALKALGDIDTYNQALKNLKSEDDFEVLKSVRFLVAYGDKSALEWIFKVMKASKIPEHICALIPYLSDFALEQDYLLALNYIIDGLGEVIGLSQVIDFGLYEVFGKLIKQKNNPQVALTLLNAQTKFNQLTENNEYLYDEDKATKNEVEDIKKMLVPYSFELSDRELDEDSEFVFFALNLVSELKLKKAGAIRNLLCSCNQTLILKSLEVLKNLGELEECDKNSALENVSDENVKAVILSL